MSEKVKLTQKQADAIINARRFNSDRFIVFKCLELGDSFETIPDIDPDTLIKALYIGYEVEQTPEDKVRERYNRYLSCEDRKYRGMAIGMKEAINILNIKIPGINT